MDYVYLIDSGRNFPQLQRMLTSLVSHTKCKILFNWISIGEEQREEISEWAKGRASFFRIPSLEWNGRRMFCKIDRLRKMPFTDGDRVFVLDTDLLIQDDIFQVFDREFDVALTSRHYSYWYSINGGVWAFNFNDRFRQFLQFYLDQIRRPTWAPFQAFQKKFKHQGELDWWCDQDFLCCIHENPPPIGAKIIDLGPKFNYCPSVEENRPESFERARGEILGKLNDPNYKILHFKGRLTEVLMSLSWDSIWGNG